MTYNGWTNYETWNVALWLDNDQGSYEYVRELAHDVLGDYSPEEAGNSRSVSELAERIEEMVKDEAPDLGASMFADLLGAALSEVDWRELAEHYLDESEEQ